jgi:hypothetical protein
MLYAGIFEFEAGKNKQSFLAALGNFSGLAQATQIAPSGPPLQFCLQRKAPAATKATINTTTSVAMRASNNFGRTWRAPIECYGIGMSASHLE